MRLPASLLNEIIPRFVKDGWQVNAHAIGDRANGVVLDAFEKAERELRDKQDLDLQHTRPRIEHAQIMTSQDLARIGRVGGELRCVALSGCAFFCSDYFIFVRSSPLTVIASIQPTHVTDDMWYGEARLGPERVKGLYAFRSMMDSGARITLGTDIPVEGINPLEVGVQIVERRIGKECQ